LLAAFAMALFTEPCFIDSNQARKQFAAVWRQVLAKAGIPPMDGGIAESCCQTNTARTLGGLAKP